MMLYHLKVKVVLYFKTKIGKFLALEFKASSLISILEHIVLILQLWAKGLFIFQEELLLSNSVSGWNKKGSFCSI